MENSLLDCALIYAGMGWHVLPLHGINESGMCTCNNENCTSPAKHPLTSDGLKGATADAATIKKWWRKWPKANIGIRTGPESGLLVLDFDKKNGGLETVDDLFNGKKPQTIIGASGGGGFHFFYSYPDGEKVGNKVGVMPGMDVRGQDGYIVVAPSIHQSGRPYTWVPEHGPGDLPLAVIPGDVLDLIKKNKSQAVSTGNGTDAVKLFEGNRNNSLFLRGCRLRGKGCSFETIEVDLMETNRKSCVPPLSDSEVKRIAQSISRYDAGGTVVEGPVVAACQSPSEYQASKKGLNDTGNAERFAEDHRHRAKYCVGIGWFVWDGKRWARDPEGLITMALAKQTVRNMGFANMKPNQGVEPSITDILDGNLANDYEMKLQKHIAASFAISRRQAMVSLARSESGMTITHSEMDTEAHLFNVSNGTVDLRTGKLLLHDPERFITRISPVEYHPGATCPGWMDFLMTVTGGEEEVVVFLQRAIGYTLTGHADERAFFIIHGPGGNGKSVFIDVLASLFGEYGQNFKAETLLAKQFEGIPNDLAKLPGVRFAHVAETDEGRRLAESKIKELTGGDTISARFLHKEWFEFKPVAKWWMGTNHRPEIRGTDSAIWDRIKLISFDYVFPKAGELGHRAKHEVMSMLHKELPGILAWAITGAQAWYKERGLVVPTTISKAVEDYKEDQDILGAFLYECCETGPGYKVLCKELYQCYVRWADQSGEPILRKRDFMANLRGRDFVTEEGRARSLYWLGIKIGELVSYDHGNQGFFRRQKMHIGNLEMTHHDSPTHR